jgi:hypothetical protein
VDNENGLRLRAGYMEYKEGAFIRARALELLSAKETFRAQSLDYDIPKQEARFTDVVFSNRDFVNLRAEAGLGLLNEGVLIAKGVRVERPNLTAEALVEGSGPKRTFRQATGFCVTWVNCEHAPPFPERSGLGFRTFGLLSQS